jgi:hypothetical protein
MESKQLINEVCSMRDENRRMTDALAGLYLKMVDKKFLQKHDVESLSRYVMDIVKDVLNSHNRK